MEIPEEHKKNLYRAALSFLVVLTLLFAVKFLSELRAYGRMGSAEVNTITLSGHGEVKAVPDVATVYFTVESSKATQAESSTEVNNKIAKILEFLKTSGVEEKDIKTEGYTSYPKYSYTQIKCPMGSPEFGTYDCVDRNQVITGYTVSQSITVKVRKVDDASKIIDGINKIGVNNMSGPNFTIDNEDNLKREARKKAIDEAKEKAQVLAKDLGVRLGRVTSFSESGNYPIPIYARAELMAADVGAPKAAELPKGENTITSDVTITYEIR